VHLRILDLLPRFGTEDVDFFLRPALTDEEVGDEPFEALGNLQVVPCAYFFLDVTSNVSDCTPD
jgi:hypothetical protein